MKTNWRPCLEIKRYILVLTAALVLCATPSFADSPQYYFGKVTEAGWAGFQLHWKEEDKIWEKIEAILEETGPHSNMFAGGAKPIFLAKNSLSQLEALTQSLPRQGSKLAVLDADGVVAVQVAGFGLNDMGCGELTIDLVVSEPPRKLKTLLHRDPRDLIAVEDGLKEIKSPKRLIPKEESRGQYVQWARVFLKDTKNKNSSDAKETSNFVFLTKTNSESGDSANLLSYDLGAKGSLKSLGVHSDNHSFSVLAVADKKGGLSYIHSPKDGNRASYEPYYIWTGSDGRIRLAVEIFSYESSETEIWVEQNEGWVLEAKSIEEGC